MILLSNGRALEYVVASGALAFDGKGWPWERILVWLRLIRPELFTIFTKSLTRQEVVGNLQWWRPWRCVRPMLNDSWVNKVALTNKGFDWWCNRVAPTIDFGKYQIAVSLFGKEEDLGYMAERLNPFPLTAVEVNPFCPNAIHPMDTIEAVVKGAKEVKRVCRHPEVVKLSAAQDCVSISKELEGTAEALSLNSVPWEMVFPGGRPSPLWRLQKKVGGGGGGVSGKLAQKHNWAVVKALVEQVKIPVIAPSITEFKDLAYVRKELRAQAVSFGGVHLPSHPVWLKPWTIFTNPCKPTAFVRREKEKLAYSIPKLFVG